MSFFHCPDVFQRTCKCTLARSFASLDIWFCYGLLQVIWSVYPAHCLVPYPGLIALGHPLVFYPLQRYHRLQTYTLLAEQAVLMVPRFFFSCFLEQDTRAQHIQIRSPEPPSHSHPAQCRSIPMQQVGGSSDSSIFIIGHSHQDRHGPPLEFHSGPRGVALIRPIRSSHGGRFALSPPPTPSCLSPQPVLSFGLDNYGSRSRLETIAPRRSSHHHFQQSVSSLRPG